MIVGIDIRFLAREKRTGIEEYALNLIPELLRLNPDKEFKLFYNAFKQEKLDFDWLDFSNARLYGFRIPNRFVFDPLAKFLRQPKIDRMMGGIDVFFSPHFLLTPVSKNCPKVATFHDLSFEYFPEFFSWRKRFWHWSLATQKRAREAEKIIAVSDSTKHDLMDIYGISEKKVQTVYHGVGGEFKKIDVREGLESIRKEYNLPQDFILYFGTIEPRKNVGGLIKAYETFRKKYPAGLKYKLVVAGERGWLYGDIFKLAAQSEFSKDIIFTGFVKPEDKVGLYNLASLFVFPSFFEGFGFPPLEAMACGVPAVVSNTSSFPETAGPGSLMIDPYNYGEIAWAMNEVLSDGKLRNDLIERGYLCAKKFSWEKCAIETMKVLESAA